MRQGHSEMVSFISGVIGQTLLCLTCVCQWPRVVFAVRSSSRCGRLHGAVIFTVRPSSRCTRPSLRLHGRGESVISPVLRLNL